MKSKFLRPSPMPTLMLTSLLDMFTIILIFLIVSFEAESYDFKLNPDLVLPQSSAREQLKPAVNVAVAGDAISVNGNVVAKLAGGVGTDAQQEAGEIPELVKALKAEYEKRALYVGESGANPAEGTEEADSIESRTIVVLQADRELDYKTLYLVLRSAANAGFFKYRLAILKS